MSTFGITPFPMGTVTTALDGRLPVDETPAGPCDGVNTVFTTTWIPAATPQNPLTARQSLWVYKNGVQLRALAGDETTVLDYSCADNVITLTKAPKTGDWMYVHYIPTTMKVDTPPITSFDIVFRSSWSMSSGSADVPALKIGYLYGPFDAPTAVTLIGGIYGETGIGTYDDLGGGLVGYLNRTYTYTFDPGGTLTGIGGPYPDPLHLFTSIYVDGSLSWNGPPDSLWLVHDMFARVTYANGTVSIFRPVVSDTEINIYGGTDPGHYVGVLPPPPTGEPAVNSGREYIYEFYPLNLECFHTSPLSTPSDFTYWTWIKHYS